MTHLPDVAIPNKNKLSSVKVEPSGSEEVATSQIHSMTGAKRRASCAVCLVFCIAGSRRVGSFVWA